MLAHRFHRFARTRPRNLQSEIRNLNSGFTLIEILVAMGVFVILGTALVGLMAAAVDAWRRGEAGRVVNERLRALQRQIADDLAAAVLDPLPPPDFHYTLDTCADLLNTDGTANDLYAELVHAKDNCELKQDQQDGRDLTYFAPISRPGTGDVTLRIRVPFVIGAAVLKARADVFDPDSSARLLVACNDPTADPPLDQEPPPDGDARWKRFAELQGEGIAGGEADASRAADGSPALKGGNIVFIKAQLDNQSDSDDAAQFLRGDLLRAGGRPVLVLDCYRDPNVLPREPRPTFAAFARNGTRVLTFTRTLPPEVERAAAATAGSATSDEYLNYADDNMNKQIDESHRPVAGRAQVVYLVRPYHVTLGRPGLGVLRRAFEAPLRQPRAGDLLDADISPNIAALVDDIPSNDFIPSVLYFGVSFWGADTTTWELRPDLEPGYAAKYDEATRPHPPSTRWLSSRYLPEQVQVTLVLEPDRGKRASTALAQAIGPDFPTAGEGRLNVLSTAAFDDVQRPAATFVRDPRHFIKVGDEWLFYSRIGSPTDFVIPRQGSDGLAARGCRGTRRAAHPAGTEVLRGATTVFTVNIPAYRHWQR